MRPRRREAVVPVESPANCQTRREVRITVPINGARITLKKTVSVTKPSSPNIEEEDPIATPNFTPKTPHGISPAPSVPVPVPPTSYRITSPLKGRAQELGSASSYAQSTDRRLITGNRNSPVRKRKAEQLDSEASYVRSTDRRLITANRNVPVSSPRTPKTSTRPLYCDATYARSIRRRISLGNSSVKASASKCDSMSPAVYSLESGGLLSDHKPLTMESVKTRSQSFLSPNQFVEFPVGGKKKGALFGSNKKDSIQERSSIGFDAQTPVRNTPEGLEEVDIVENPTHVRAKDLNIHDGRTPTVEKEKKVESESRTSPASPLDIDVDIMRVQQAEQGKVNERVRRAPSPRKVCVIESPESSAAADPQCEKERTDEIEITRSGSVGCDLSQLERSNWSDGEDESVAEQLDEISESSDAEVQVVKTAVEQELSFEMSDGGCSTEPPSPTGKVDKIESERSTAGYSMACRPLYVTIPAGALRSPRTPDASSEED